MPVYRIRKSSNTDLVKQGGNAPDTAGVMVDNTSGNLLKFCGDGSTVLVATDTTTAQTLTNKTLTAPTISAPVLSGTATGTYTLGGTPTISSPTINSPTVSSLKSAFSTSTVSSGYNADTYL